MPLRTTRMRRRDRWGGWSYSIGVWRVTEQKHRPEKEADGKKSGKENSTYPTLSYYAISGFTTWLTWHDCPANISHLMLNWSTFQPNHSTHSTMWYELVSGPHKERQGESKRVEMCAAHAISKLNFICFNWHIQEAPCTLSRLFEKKMVSNGPFEFYMTKSGERKRQTKLNKCLRCICNFCFGIWAANNKHLVCFIIWI